MTVVATAILDRAEETLGESLPRIGGAFLVLLAGLALAWLAGRVATRVLRTVGLDGLGDRLGVHDVLARVGLERSLSRAVGRAIRITLAIVAIVASVSLLGLAALSGALSEVILFLPKLLVALVFVLLGVVAARFVGERVGALTEQMGLGAPLAEAAQAAVLTLAVLTALAQLGVPTLLLIAMLGILVSAAALTLALAFGLGGRDVARQLNAGRYVRQSFDLGQHVAVGDESGTIVAFEGTATVLSNAAGQRVRVPNQRLVDEVVVVGGP